MSKKTPVIDCTPEHALMLKNEIGKVRAWLTGFQAAGKAGPPGEDALRQVQILLQNIAKSSSPTNENAAP